MPESSVHNQRHQTNGTLQSSMSSGSGTHLCYDFHDTLSSHFSNNLLNHNTQVNGMQSLCHMSHLYSVCSVNDLLFRFQLSVFFQALYTMVRYMKHSYSLYYPMQVNTQIIAEHPPQGLTNFHKDQFFF